MGITQVCGDSQPYTQGLNALNRSTDWINQASKDLEAANDSLKTKHYEWSCFQAQQSAEKAFKALLLYNNVDAWGHGVVHLYKKWKEIQDRDVVKPGIEKKHELNVTAEPVGLLSICQELDRHYIQPRYPNGFASGFPAEYYDETTAKECVDHARVVVDFVKDQIAHVSRRG